MKHFVELKNLCWWNEWAGYDKDGNDVYTTQSGYYLASYMLGNDIKHIVAINSITSCVVRHIEEGKLFFDKAEAKANLEQINKER